MQSKWPTGENPIRVSRQGEMKPWLAVVSLACTFAIASCLLYAVAKEFSSNVISQNQQR